MKGQVLKKRYSFIDLFAGIGGTRLGFEQAGCKCVFTSEWDTHARKTYEENFPEIKQLNLAKEDRFVGDITKVKSENIPDHDILVAGFPCQPFSISGVSKKKSLNRKHGFEDETQGTLFFEIARILHDKRPRAFLLENVKNLIYHNRGRTYSIIMRVLQENLGYSVYPYLVDGKSFVPQHRERIYLIGFHRPMPFTFTSHENRNPKLRDILGKAVDNKYTLSDKLWNYLKEYKKRKQAQGTGFGYGLVGADDVARTLSARYYKDGSEILIKQENRNPRRLTPRECARLMGFPDTFKIPVSDTQAYKQFGNSVVVPVIAAVAKDMVRVMRYYDSEIEI